MASGPEADSGAPAGHGARSIPWLDTVLFQALLWESSEFEAELLRSAAGGDEDARRTATALASQFLIEGRQLSPAMSHWIGCALSALAAPDAEQRKEAMLVLGATRAPGRPFAESNEQLDLELEQVGAVLFLEEQFGKGGAVQAVAHACGLSESKVWALCKKYRGVRGTERMSRSMLARLRDASRREPLLYSKELREFLEVPDTR